MLLEDINTVQLLVLYSTLQVAIERMPDGSLDEAIFLILCYLIKLLRLIMEYNKLA